MSRPARPTARLTPPHWSLPPLLLLGGLPNIWLTAMQSAHKDTVGRPRAKNRMSSGQIIRVGLVKLEPAVLAWAQLTANIKDCWGTRFTDPKWPFAAST